MRIGLVGCGRMGRAHLASIGELPEIQVAAIVDPVGDLSPYKRTTFRRLVASPDIDAVLIASPTVSHEELAREALENDKHVLCEKPLTLNPKSDRDLGRLAAERRLVLQVGFWRRFAEPYLKMREILAFGAIGVPTAVRTAQWDAQPPPVDFCDPRKSGGLEVDCGIHEFDLVRWLTGSRVEAITGCSPTVSSILGHVGDIDTVIGVARLSGGRSMAIDLTRTAGGKDSIRTEIIGDRGAIVVEITDATSSVLTRLEDTSTKWESTQEPIAVALRAQMRAFVDGVRQRCLVVDAAGAEDSRLALSQAFSFREARILENWIACDDQ